MNLLFLAEISLRALFGGLDPLSLSQNLAFYELYPECNEGRRALERAEKLVGGSCELLTKTLHHEGLLDEETIRLIDRLAASFPNRKLKGYHARSVEELLALPSEEIDLSKALLLMQLEEEGDRDKKTETYMALLDLMALKVRARLSPNAQHEEVIKELNYFVFYEMRFRFPPHSTYAKNIDLFTFLPSVMDNHIGVCLGVTTLYLALAQRLDLPLEIITPPGHIFLRYKGINIETTARGVHMPDETYETLHVKEKFVSRAMKEVVGMTYINKASIYLERGEYHLALRDYEKAIRFLPDDSHSKELMAFALLLTGQEKKGKELLLSLGNEITDLSEDILGGNARVEGLKALFLPVNETRSSILKKKERMEEEVKRYPRFRDGLEQIAICYIQLNRPKEAIYWLKKYAEVDEKNTVIQYYLAVLYAEREDFASAWSALKLAEKHFSGVSDKVLVKLREELYKVYPHG